ncbi:MAG TPA: hypothetical protein VMS60_14910 [Solirubrobacterales bacterium]|nr:hypothetical protein [Solirubrobacterales bacterium]
MRAGLGRIVAIGIGLAVALLLLVVGEAQAGRYTVAQCGWFVGADADWADSTGGVKFRPDAFCVPPPGSDPFASAHTKSFTRDGQATVSGTRFARWRWVAPPGTGITQVRGTWWHALHDGLEQRIGVGNAGGGFEPFLSAAATDTAPREFVRGFPAPMPALEDRLLCARPENKSCSLAATSWSALRALTITIDDPQPPVGGIDGELVVPGWQRGVRSAAVNGIDFGSGARFGETRLDGTRIALAEFPCQLVLAGGEWRGSRMQPCASIAGGGHSFATTTFSDGPHSLVYCVSDFATNSACTAPRTIKFDNNPPAHPRSVALVGGDGWRRLDDFDLTWANPDQGPASPIAGAAWRFGRAGFDSGVRFAPGRDRAALSDVSVPGPGVFSLQIWLRDEAGNEAPSTAVTVPLRFDDVAPAVAFAGNEGGGFPERLMADVEDLHSSPGGGTILYRRADAPNWTELPTKLVAGDVSTRAHLVAPLPEILPGTYVFRAEATDAAGNTAATTLRTDGTQMALRRAVPAEVQRARTRLFARLRGGHGRGDSLTVPFAAPALLSGRLTRADGAGIAGRELHVVARPSRGALVPNVVASVVTGARGGFELRLDSGPSRQIAVAFPGDGGLEESSRGPLDLRVRSGVSLKAKPLALRTGQLVRLSGRVRSRGAPIPRRGKLVAIQYLEAETGRWRPVLVTRSDHGGRFRARYRFRYVEGSAAIRLRATALAEERWPYAPGSSAPVTLHVSG